MNILEAKLKELSLSKMDLAKLTDIPYSTLARAVSNPDKRIKCDDAIMIAKHLELEPSEAFPNSIDVKCRHCGKDVSHKPTNVFCDEKCSTAYYKPHKALVSRVWRKKLKENKDDNK